MTPGRPPCVSSSRAHPGEYALKGHQDILTEADTFVEKQVLTALAGAFPNDLILGEESASQPASAESLWVVDPIDGTANFARGIPHFCVCMAWVRQGVTELGAIYNPVSQELYLARRGHYALKNGQPLRCTAITDPQRAAVELGLVFPSQPESLPEGAGLIAQSGHQRAPGRIRGAGAGLGGGRPYRWVSRNSYERPGIAWRGCCWCGKQAA
ncbi:Inositol-1-monophosphatase [Leclercia adecarboxylata]|uniref:Inositol-1-monophosphatase n=1 Tax=Leclercia adecarboxylata TaxID=83655 RepID=A0A4U9HRS3_9ENTR|nr:Inositol-1-monophosphatase [Leclercia adecarboxylata]